MQTLDLPALQVAGNVDEIWRSTRKASHGATRKLPKSVVARQLAASVIRTFRVKQRAYPTAYHHYRVPSGDVDPRPRAPPLSPATRQDQDVADQESFPAPRKHRSIRAGS
jgi:hypothetical protein